MIASSLLALLGFLGSARASAVPPEVPPLPALFASERVQIFLVSDARYRELEPADQLFPDSPRRLVVFRGGLPILDRGLRDEKRRVPGSGGDAPAEEEGVFEDAEIVPDGRAAVILSNHYRRLADAKDNTRTRGRTELTWVDPAHPRGLWSLPLEEGRWVKTALPLSAKQGVAVSTVDALYGPADLRIYGPEGTEVLRMQGELGSVVSLSATPQGAFLAVDLAYPERAGGPNRGITVLDLLHGTSWIYPWSYGQDGEPLSWSLAETGVLEVTTPEGTRGYDRNGRPLRKTKRK